MTETTTPILKMTTKTTTDQHANDWAQEGFMVDTSDPLHLMLFDNEFKIVNTSPNRADFHDGATRRFIYGNSGDVQTINLGTADTTYIKLYSSETEPNEKPFVTLKLTKKGDDEL
jgi:hypothetical protein